jgi:hypothetical protein
MKTPQQVQARSATGTNSSRTTSTGISSISGTPPSVVLCNHDTVFNATVSRVVNETIFPRQQFVILEQELDSRGKLATKCLQEFNMEVTKWHEVKEVVRKQINRVRNNKQQAVRKSLLSK